MKKKIRSAGAQRFPKKAENGYNVVLSPEFRQQIASAPDDVKGEIAQLLEDFRTGKKDPSKVGERVCCNRIDVPLDCCFLRFGDGTNYEFSDPEFETVRGEQMIIDYDKDGKVIGIELLSSDVAKKRCQ
jgi:hypothetical protein